MRLYFLLILFIPYFIQAQTRFEHNYEYDYSFQRDDAGKIIFEEILSEPCKSKEELFKKALTWFSSYSDGVLGLKMITKDFENGQILGKGRTDNFIYTKSHYSTFANRIETNYSQLNHRGTRINRGYRDGGYFTYKVELNFKEKKTRIRFFDIEYHAGSVKGMKDGALLNEHYPKTWRKFGKNLLKKEWYQYKRIAIQELNDFVFDYSTQLAIDILQEW